VSSGQGGTAAVLELTPAQILGVASSIAALRGGAGGASPKRFSGTLAELDAVMAGGMI